MSAVPITSPIQRLDLDVLWHIFNINANIFDDDEALDTTLDTSYVCHKWRSLLLNSTSIWAHIICLDHRQWRTAKGSRELIRRTGTALLWIKTHKLIQDRYRKKKNILDIIDMHWDRIQKLEVTIHNDLMNQSPLRQPALYLESLRIRIVCYHETPELCNISQSLFSGSAPMLRDLRWNGYGLNVTTISWLRQIRCMEFTSTLTVSAILRVLESTINLTNLQICHVVADKGALTLPFVSLPKLAHLDFNLTDTLTAGAILLEHLRIPSYCTVIVSAQEIREGEMDKDSTFRPIITAISSCAQRCFADHPPQRLQFELTRTSFLLEATNYSREPYLLFSINMVMKLSDQISSEARTTFLQEFSKSGLSKVTLFEVRISRGLHFIYELATFMECLPSVETLVTSKPILLSLRPWTLPTRRDLPPRMFFPALKTLRLRSFKLSSKFWRKSDKPRDPVSKYVMGRIAWGQAISVVDFGDVTFDALPNMTFIRKADGVKVLWRQSDVPGIQEYICGTSAPLKVEGV